MQCLAAVWKQRHIRCTKSSDDRDRPVPEVSHRQRVCQNVSEQDAKFPTGSLSDSRYKETSTLTSHLVSDLT